MNAATPLTIKGFQVFKGLLSLADQRSIVEDIRAIVRQAPLYQPVTPGGRKMSVLMTCAGNLGWVTDQTGYRYQPHHPNGPRWPSIPESVLKVWTQTSQSDRMPDCCLVNFYAQDARMGMHQDKDEGNFEWPVVSISLGDDALFRIGNPERGGKTESVWLNSGDVVVMGGAARLAYHGVDRIRFGSSTLLSQAGRINLTLRVVDQGKREQQPS